MKLERKWKKRTKKVETIKVDGVFGPTTWTKQASGWWRAQFPTIQDGLVVRYRPSPHDNRTEISVSRDGIVIDVPVPAKPIDMRAIQKVLSDAGRAYQGIIDDMACF